MLKFIIPDDNKYITIKDVLKKHYNMSNNLLIKLKKENRFKLNNKDTYINEKVFVGDILTIDFEFIEESENVVATKMDLNILFEDEFLLILDKPSNMPVHPTSYNYDNTLANGVKYYFDLIGLTRKIRPVNRLDRDTSGIVIFAKNDHVHSCLNKQMKEKIFTKEYIAVLNGVILEDSGTLNFPIARKENSIIERCVNIEGAVAITHFSIIKRFNDSCVAKIILETGRTHQIRVHMSHIGHAIIGDTLYGNESEFISRQALHAYKTTFIHPILNTEIVIVCELPDDIEKLCLFREVYS